MQLRALLNGNTPEGSNPVMLEHLHSEGWINSGKYSEITFETKSISDVKKDGDKLEASMGVFSLHGISKEITFLSTYLLVNSKLAMAAM